MVVPPYRITFNFKSGNEKSTPLKFGVGASTRSFKKAVDRNRIKRLTREAWRLQKNELQQQLLEQNRELDVFFIYIGKELPDFNEVSAQVKAAIKKLMTK